MINEYGYKYGYILEAIDRDGVTIIWYLSDDGLFYPNESVMKFYPDGYWNK